MSFKDAELTDVLRLFAKVGGVNVIIDPANKGKTLNLQLEDVPSDQALELVLKTQGLAGLVEGNVLRVVPVSSFVAEANATAQLREAREAAAELRTTAIRFSNIDAKAAEAIVRKNLSPRGTTVVDACTNTLLITDIDRGGLQASDIAEPPPAPVQSGASASFEVRLLELSGAVPEGLSPATLAALPGARTLGSALVLLGLGRIARGRARRTRCFHGPAGSHRTSTARASWKGLHSRAGDRAGMTTPWHCERARGGGAAHSRPRSPGGTDAP